MNNRIKEVRKKNNLSQSDFGKVLGLGHSAVSRLESGYNNPTNLIIKGICREFDIDYRWLTTGEGNMMNDDSDVFLDEISLEYKLSEDDKYLVKCFLGLNQEERNVVTKFLNTFSKKK